MPFEDESFDMIISMGGPVKIVEDSEKVKKILQETQRLLKDNGEARIGQGWISPNVLESPKEALSVEERFKYFREKSLEYLESLGFSKVEEVQKGEDIKRDTLYKLEEHMPKYVAKSEKTSWRIIDGNVYVLVPESGSIQVLNSVGTRIWKLVNGKMTVEEIVLRFL